MPESDKVPTPGQARTMVLDADPEEDSDGVGEAEEEDGGQVRPMEADEQDLKESGAGLSPSATHSNEPGASRDFRITRTIVQDLGPSDNCRACESLAEGRPVKGQVHTPACRL